MLSDKVSILDGGTFVVSDRRGDIEASPIEAYGLFHNDTRYLSRFCLTINGVAPTVLSVDDSAHYAAQFFLVQPSGCVVDDARLSLIRRRSLDLGFRDEITILSHCQQEIDLDVRIAVDADFADLFEVKEQLRKAGDHYREVTDGQLVLGYRRGTYTRQTIVTTDEASCVVTEDGLRFSVHLPARGEWSTTVQEWWHRTCWVTRRSRRRAPASFASSSARDASLLEAWRVGFPTSHSDWARIASKRTGKASTDLAALRLPGNAGLGAGVPAAGLPWFMALFGRDSIITSYQALPFAPELGRSDAANAGAHPGQNGRRLPRRGARQDPARAARRRARPRSGNGRTRRTTAPPTATPLFLVLLDEYERWTGDEALVYELEPQALAALDWIDQYGDRDGDGYVEYETAEHADRAREPVLEGLLELDPVRRRAHSPRAARHLRDPGLRLRRQAAHGQAGPRRSGATSELAERLEGEAAALSASVQPRTSGSPSAGTSRSALDGDKRQVDTLTSNIGHLLWSGIVDADKADALPPAPDRPAPLLRLGRADDGRRRGGYNPIGYHNGTVWPHDNSLIAAGLRPLRLPGGGREASPSACSRPARTSASPAAGGVRRLPRAASPAIPVEVPDGVQPAGVGGRGNRCCSSAPSSAWRSTAGDSTPTRRFRRRSASSTSRVYAAVGAALMCARPIRRAHHRTKAQQTGCVRSWRLCQTSPVQPRSANSADRHASTSSTGQAGTCVYATARSPSLKAEPTPIASSAGTKPTCCACTAGRSLPLSRPCKGC